MKKKEFTEADRWELVGLVLIAAGTAIYEYIRGWKDGEDCANGEKR